MRLKMVRFVTLVLVALLLGPSLAHLLELPNKIDLPRDDYLTVQQIYWGWAWLGILFISALISTFVLTVLLWKHSKGLGLTLAALFSIIGMHIVFWTFTYPANVATQNWTVLPDNWIELRKQWEYSHATSAALNFAAFTTLLLSIFVTEKKSPWEGATR
ncbi:MAG TPA: hypothetical protein VH681_02360 [Nitrospiraceae bacterium]